MASQQVSTNTFGVAKFIVSADATQGTHTTIAGALTSASSGDTIFIRNGSYTENLTLKAGVNLSSLTGDQNNANVIVTGKLSASFVGSCSISNIEMITSSDFAISITGSSATVVNCYFCSFNGLNNTPLSCASSSSGAGLNLFACNGNLATTGLQLFTCSGGQSSWYNSNFSNTGASTTASAISGGLLSVNNCVFSMPFTTSSTGILNTAYTTFNCTAVNATCLTMGGTASTSNLCEYKSGTASAVSVGTSWGSTGDLVGSSNTNAITGAGAISYSPIAFGNSTGMNVTTQVPIALGPGGHFGLKTGTPAAGFIGEQIRSAIAAVSGVTLTTATAANVTSISLTAGIWDVTGVVMFNGVVTGTSQGASVGTVSATVGTQGDNYITGNGASNTIDNGLVVPAYRISLTSTTTVYLVGISVFTAGTQKAYGRISATRVG
jgi:hypothetical protein